MEVIKLGQMKYNHNQVSSLIILFTQPIINKYTINKFTSPFMASTNNDICCSAFLECQTQDISPHKQSQNHATTKPFTMLSQLTTQHQSGLNSKKPSRTQEEIYSHGLISSIMQKREKHTVSHHVGHFDPETQLYGKPKDLRDSGMMEFSDQRRMYQSEYTKKIGEINKRLNCGKSLSERVKNRKNEGNDTFYRTKRPASAQVKNNANVHNKISVSGLVSYNFNSVNARKTLGYDFERDQDKLNSILSKLQTRNQCCISRQHCLVQKKKQQKATKQHQIKQAIFSDFDTGTKPFLNNLHEQITEEKTVYGMKWSKLLCIKELMEKEKIGYEQAEAILNEIETKRVKEVKKEEVRKRETNDEGELNARRQVVQRGRVMLKQLYFTD